jgi:glycosyltransferase involved in cell wall biosynthesis
MFTEYLPFPVRVTEQIWPKNTKPLVSVCCITYNHVNYIRECIEGFLMQETRFPVEILIHDDASTDGTAAIVREYQDRYPTLIHSILQTDNLHSKGKKPFSIVLKIASGTFIAPCEGDDFWTYPRKLHEQEQIFQKRTDIALISHGCSRLGENGENLIPWLRTEGSGFKEYHSSDVMEGVYDHLNTWMYRRPEPDLDFVKLMDSMPVGDMPLNLYLLRDGRKAVSLEKIWSCYRYHIGGVWTGSSRFRRLVQMLVIHSVHKAFYKTTGSKVFNKLLRAVRNEIIVELVAAIVLFNTYRLRDEFRIFLQYSSEYFRPVRQLVLLFAHIPTGLLLYGYRRIKTLL